MWKAFVIVRKDGKDWIALKLIAMLCSVYQTAPTKGHLISNCTNASALTAGPVRIVPNRLAELIAVATADVKLVLASAILDGVVNSVMRNSATNGAKGLFFF